MEYKCRVERSQLGFVIIDADSPDSAQELAVNNVPDDTWTDDGDITCYEVANAADDSEVFIED